MPQAIPSKHFAFFTTAIGECAVVWNRRGLVSLMLPERSHAALEATIHQRFNDARESAPDRSATQAMRSIVTLLEGQTTDLSEIELDMLDLPPFHRRVYQMARSIGFGKTLSYGELAARLGCPNAARAVGQALGRNPFALIVPCHRVLAASGNLKGFSAYGGILMKRRLLDLERSELATQGSNRVVDRSPHRSAARKRVARSTTAPRA
jgi:methylated-DNA-[protein]-cysteine S-methyltransferase